MSLGGRLIQGRVVLVGEYGDEAEALDPEEVGSLGWRIMRLIQQRCPNATREGYLQAFERYVLCPGMSEFDFPTALANAPALWETILAPGKEPPTYVVLIGMNTHRAMGLSGDAHKRRLKLYWRAKGKKFRDYPYFLPFRYKGTRVRKIKDLSNFLISGGDELKMVIHAILFCDLYLLGLGQTEG